MRWQYDGLVADTVRAWMEDHGVAVDPGWVDAVEYRATAADGDERGWRWRVSVDVPVRHGTLRLEVMVAERPCAPTTATVTRAERPDRPMTQWFTYDPKRGWHEDTDPELVFRFV